MSDAMSPRHTRLISLTKMHSVIPHDVLSVEADLMVSKWPEYRFLTPEKATTLFVSEYRKAVREHYRRTVDRDLAENIRAGDRLSMAQNNAHYTQMWKARQFADELGLPSNFFLSFSFDFASRRKRRALPQPTS